MDSNIAIEPSVRLRKFLETVTAQNPQIAKEWNTNYYGIPGENEFSIHLESYTKCENKRKPINMNDLHKLFEYIQRENELGNTKIYLHELLEGSDLVLPCPLVTVRNADLEARCQKLKTTIENKIYDEITKNVNCVRSKNPQNSIGYQLKQINKYWIAVFQLVVSVVTGFIFGFLGINLLYGHLDMVWRLLLGILCASLVGVAELYFLIINLNIEQ